MDRAVGINAHDAFALGDAPARGVGIAVFHALEHRGEAAALLGVQVHRLGVAHAQLGALLQGGDHRHVAGGGHEDRMAGAVEGLGLHSRDLVGRQHLEVEGVGQVGEGGSPQGGEQGEQDRHLHDQGQAAGQGAAELLHQLAQFFLLLLGIAGVFGLDLGLALLHHRLGDAHAAGAAD